MRSTIDKAGRLVIPKHLRDQLGFRPGDVELTADGAALRVVVPLPPPARTSPGAVARLIAHNFPATRFLSDQAAAGLLARLGTRGMLAERCTTRSSAPRLSSTN